jgi:hypothetical protein
MAGGPRRTTEEVSAIPPQKKKSLLKKALPYLLSGGGTGIGIGFSLNTFLS